METGRPRREFSSRSVRQLLLLRAQALLAVPGYKKTGLTAGFDPNGGGFAQYVRAMPWIAERGMVAIPDDVSFEEATFIEPVNTCLKAVRRARVAPGENVLVIGQGPVGLLLMMLAKLEGANVYRKRPDAGAPREIAFAGRARSIRSGGRQTWWRKSARAPTDAARTRCWSLCRFPHW